MGDWEATAREIRRACHTAIVVVQAAGISDLSQLLLSPDCDRVNMDTRPGWATQWALEPIYHVPDKIKEDLVPLKKVMEQLEGNAGRHKLDLHLRMRSTQAASEELRAVLKSFSSTLYQLRVLESLTFFSKQSFPLTGIKVLGFSLPYRFDLIPHFQAAVSSLPKLRELQLYLLTPNSTKHANLFLKLLPRLPKVTSLRVSVRQHELTLLSSSLVHINNLELGWKVTVDNMPWQLKHLCLQSILHDTDPLIGLAFEGYEDLFSELAAGSPVDLSVQTCNSTTLLELPSNIISFCTLQSLAKSKNHLTFLDCQTAFKRFSRLKVLHLGDFLTDDLIAMLAGVTLPLVDTVGFIFNLCMEVKKPHYKNVDGEHIWTPSRGVFKLATVFPALRHFKVTYTGMLTETYVLMSDFISRAHFPKLMGVTCCSRTLKIVFRNISPLCYLVNKLDAY